MSIYPRKILVTGNLAGDLDSTVCTITLAQLLSRTEKGLVIPLLRKTRKFLPLNPEIPALLNFAAYNIEEIVFQETPDGRKLIEDRESRFFLVDHNHPEGIGDEPLLSGIIDHHRDSGYAPSLPVRIIESCGSCASLVSREWLRRGGRMERKTAMLLAAAIIVDTGDFNPEWGKTTSLDISEYSRLDKLLLPEDRDFLKTLLQIKGNLSHLSLLDHLRRDYKEIPRTGLGSGICSVLLSGDEFFSPPFFRQQSVNRFLRDQGLDHLFILHTIQNPLRRQLSLYISDKSPLQLQRDLLNESLLALKEIRLRPSPPQRPLPPGWTIYQQEESRASRKIVLPLLQKTVQKIKGEIFRGDTVRGA